MEIFQDGPVPSTAMERPPDKESEAIEVCSLTPYRPQSVLHIFRAASTNPPGDPGPPPDGGWRAWSQVLGCHLIMFNSWGYISCFGFFQAYYVESLGATPSAVSWIVSTQLFLLFFIGAFSGRAMDAGYYFQTVLAGMALRLISVLTTSFATTYWQVFLSEALCGGIGHGLVYAPSVALISTYFVRKRSFAITIVLCGGSTGGIVFPVIAQHLPAKIGLSWAIRVMFFVVLVNYGIALILVRTRIPPRKTGPFFELAAFKEAPYTLFLLGTFLILWGVYNVYYYTCDTPSTRVVHSNRMPPARLVTFPCAVSAIYAIFKSDLKFSHPVNSSQINSYATNVIHMSPSSSLNQLLALNAIGIPGRILPAMLSDRMLGPLNTYIPLCLASGALLYCWIAVKNTGGLYIWVIVYGLVGAGVQGMFPSALASLTTDLSKMGVRVGMILSILAFACLTGSPLTGALIERGHGSYLYAQIFGGTSLVTGTIIIVAARIAGAGYHLRKKL